MVTPYLIILFILIGPTHLVEDIPLILSPMDSSQLYPNFLTFKNLKIITLKLRYSTVPFLPPRRNSSRITSRINIF